MFLDLMYITNNPDIALIAEKAGVNRIWIDLETLGKEERQKGMNTVKSKHCIDDIKRIANVLKKSKIQVRINPLNENSKNEIEEVLSAGAQYVMLPMWKSTAEVKNFISMISGRANTILLLETKEAEECLDDVLKIKGVDEIHIGLNDLHLSYGLSFMFELLTNGTVERIAKKIKRVGIPYGFGGISHLGDGLIPAEMVVAEHYRLGSTGAILSRGFCDVSSGNLRLIEKQFTANMNKLIDFENYLESEKSKVFFYENKRLLKDRVQSILESKGNG